MSKRAPCPGSQQSTLGGCWQQNVEGSKYPLYINVTQDHWDTGLHDVNPHFNNIQACNPSELCPGDAGPCGPYDPAEITGSGTGVFNSGPYRNYYKLDPNGGTQDLSYCRAFGWKAVQAQKCHHGKKAFNSNYWGVPDDFIIDGPYVYCAYQTAKLTPDTTNYLSLSATATYSWTDHTGTGDYSTATVTRSSVVDKHSGRITDSGTDSVSSSSPMYDADSLTAATNAVLMGNDTLGLVYSMLGDNLYSGMDVISGSGGTWHVEWHMGTGELSRTLDVNMSSGHLEIHNWAYVDPFGAPHGTPAVYTEISHTTLDVSATSLSYTYYNLNECTGVWADSTTTVTATLTGVYTGADVEQECIKLLDYWDLADPRLTWRTDGYYTYCPMVSYNEPQQFPRAPLLQSDASYTDTSFPYCDGSILGLPLPAGYDGFFDPLHSNFDECQPGTDGTWVTVIKSYGAPSAGAVNVPDARIPKAATQWTNQENAWTLYPFGAASYINGVMTLQKYCETIITKPSYNFARPCGADRLLCDESTSTCISSYDVPSLTIILSSASTINTGDKVFVSGTGTSLDGGWTATQVDPYQYTLSNQLFSATDYPSSFSGMRIAKLRFPWAPAICGSVNVANATNENPVKLTFAQKNYLFDGDQIVITGAQGNTAINGAWTISKATDGTITIPVAGNGVYTGGATARSLYGTSYPDWNDSEPKGDFTVLNWSFNYRDIGEYQRLQTVDASAYSDPYTFDGHCPISTIADPRPIQAANGLDEAVTGMNCFEDCLPVNGCTPSVVVIEPADNTNSFDNAKKYNLGSATADLTYNGRWQGQVKQFMQDPLWQAPACPCALSDITYTYGCNTGWAADDGSCLQPTVDAETGAITDYYAYPPYVEARCTLPDGAPPLPAGYSFGCASYDDVSSAGYSGAPVCNAPNAPGHADPNPDPIASQTIWETIQNQEACVCGQGRFYVDYEKDLVTCNDPTSTGGDEPI